MNDRIITDRITISNHGHGMNEALNLAEYIADTMKLEGKNKFHLRLLAEEMFSMVRAITGEFRADFWGEAEKHTCKLHLQAKAELDYLKRRELLSVSTHGKNIASRGMMEKIREIIEAGLYSIEESFNLQNEYGVNMLSYGAMGLDTEMSDAIYSWSMQKYKSDVEAERSENPDAWDELEKSIIANIADEVQVGINKDSIELIIQKNF